MTTSEWIGIAFWISAAMALIFGLLIPAVRYISGQSLPADQPKWRYRLVRNASGQYAVRRNDGRQLDLQSSRNRTFWWSRDEGYWPHAWTDDAELASQAFNMFAGNEEVIDER